MGWFKDFFERGRDRFRPGAIRRENRRREENARRERERKAEEQRIEREIKEAIDPADPGGSIIPDRK